MKFCKDGVWQAVWVEDSFPCFDSFPLKPCFSRAVGRELWVLLLEKAWAKIWGSYQNIVAGDCSEALRDLTGAPTRTIYTNEEKKQGVVNKEMMEVLERNFSEKQQWIITAGTQSEEKMSQSTFKSIGLVPSHAYSIIKIFQIQKNLIILKIRNPWGKIEWKGDWSDESPLWNQETQKITGF